MSDFVDYYAKVKGAKPSNVRELFRHTALNALCILDKMNAAEKWLEKPRVQFIISHHVFKDEEYKFVKLLEKLAQHYTFISYSDAVNKIITRSIDRPYLTFSFDDGFNNHVAAAEIMNRFGATSCFFINPSVIGETSFEKITKHAAEKLHLPPVKFMNWKGIEKLQKLGHEVGSHTWAHKNVAEMSLIEFENDLVQSDEVLNKYCGKVQHFAHPYGRFHHFNKKAFDIVFKMNYASCANAERGCHIEHDTPLSKEQLYVRRDDIVIDWDIKHIMYFLTKSARTATTKNNLFPNFYL